MEGAQKPINTISVVEEKVKPPARRLTFGRARVHLLTQRVQFGIRVIVAVLLDVGDVANNLKFILCIRRKEGLYNILEFHILEFHILE